MSDIYKNKLLKNISNEIWKDIENYEGLYSVSNMGRIISKRSSVHKILTQRLNKGGYLSIKFCVNYKGKNFLVHRLVFAAFVGEYTKEFNHTNHKDSVRTNNKYSNLERCNSSYNNKYAYKFGHKKAVCMIGEDNPQSISVVMLDLEGRYIQDFPTILDACKKIKFKSRSGLRIYKIGEKICANKGFVFMYKNEYDKIKKKHIRIVLPKFRTSITDKRTVLRTKELTKVVQLDTDGNMIEIFDSYKLAEEKIGKKGVLDVCRKRVSVRKNGKKIFHLTCGGYKWVYYTDYKKNK